MKGTMEMVKKGPEQFDASQDTVDQLWATSKDGTNPTYINAYGGFQVSETLGYSGNIGKLWLEHGGVYVLANIRGGGEFGPRGMRLVSKLTGNVSMTTITPSHRT